MERIKMTKQQFVDFLGAIKGCEFVGVDTTTIVKMNKRNNPFYGRVTKRVVAQYNFNAEYESSVNRHLAKEGLENNFKTEGLTWGEWLSNEFFKKVITHKGELYIRLYPLADKISSFEYLIDGRVATPEESEEIKQFIPQKSESKKQADAGLEEKKQVQVTTFNFNSINVIRIHNTEIYLED